MKQIRSALRVSPAFAATLLAVVLVAASCRAADRSEETANPLQFTITYDEDLAESYTGRVYVLLSSNEHMDPLHLPQWFGSDPFVALDVAGWEPGEPLRITANRAAAFPVAMHEFPEDEYTIRAVMRLNSQSPWIGIGEGNAFSDALQAVVGGGNGGEIALHINERVDHDPFRVTQRIRLAELRSDLLSDFQGRGVTIRAAVILPEGYDESAKREYPALYWIGGFGSDHETAPFIARMWGRLPGADDFVIVVLDPLCFGGHHVFADSENNGPRGTALVEEFIPHLEAQYRLLDEPEARLVSGISSGGWASLWLQVAYPDFFGGVWSFAPDPIDFSDFQRINLYADGANMYHDESGEPRPIAHRNGKPFGWYRAFAAMEEVYGEGGQLRSFEWVFSPRGEDGLPRELFDRETGAVNSEVAEAWKRYDIRRILEENWQELEPKLAGRLHIFVGDQDTFYLDGAVANVKEALERLNADAVVEIHPGKDHGSIMDRPMRERAMREMAEAVDSVPGARLRK